MVDTRAIEQSGHLVPVIPSPQGGHAFVWYGDCCTGIEGNRNAKNFAAVNGVFRRLDAMPDHVAFIGDNIMGGGVDAAEHRRQWRNWFYQDRPAPIHQLPSNHNTATPIAEAVFRETFPDIPANGPAGQRGLSYWVRDNGLLMVFVNTNFSGLGGSGHVESEWLEEVLTQHADAAHRVVFGHHPIWPVNGYAFSPLWSVVPDEGARFWDVLVRHRVDAYVCSHIIAFDVQVHRGVLQILTGGAGTDSLMPPQTEYFHLMQGVIDDSGLRYQVLDIEGKAREWLRWPLPGPAAWTPFSPEIPLPAPASTGSTPLGQSAWIARFHIRAECPVGGSHTEQTLIAGWSSGEGPETIAISLTGAPPRLTVRLVPVFGNGAQIWEGPILEPGQPLAIEVAIHSAMGPGGVLWRRDGGTWSSLQPSSARGAEALTWPVQWAVGRSQSGPTDRAFTGSGLRVEYALDEYTFAGSVGLAGPVADR